MFHKYGNFEGCISGANTVSSNRSFSYAIFKRRIHDALTTRFVFKNSFIFFLFILLLLLFYIYIYTKSKSNILSSIRSFRCFFFSFSLLYIYFFFFPLHLSRIETSLPSSNRSARFDWLVGLAHFFSSRSFDPPIL